MRLGELMRRYAGRAEKQIISEPEPGPVSPRFDLPADLSHWAGEWQKKFKENVRDLQIAFDLNKIEAEEAALPAVQYELMKQQARELSKQESDDE